MQLSNFFKKDEEYNYAQKATAALVGVLVSINILPVVVALSKMYPIIPVLVSIAAQVFFVMFVYFSLLWLGKK